MDIIITIPKTTDFDLWMKEVELVEDDKSMSLYFKIPSKPEKAGKWDRCYILYDGFIIGYHLISSILWKQSFKCTTTNNIWDSGCYIERKGKFFQLNNPIPMKGFQGFRYYRGEKIK